MTFLGYLVQGEEGFASNWSIVHFLSGYVPHAIWAWWIDGATWVSLYMLVTAACIFELVENTPGAGRIMWTWIGYSDATYHTDSLFNSVSDVLFLLLGWLVAQVAHMLVPEVVGFWVLMGVAAALFLLFLWLFTRERAQWKVNKQRTAEGMSGSTGAFLPAATTLPRIVASSSAGGARSSRWSGTTRSKAVAVTVAPVACSQETAAAAKPRVSFVL